MGALLPPSTPSYAPFPQIFRYPRVWVVIGLRALIEKYGAKFENSKKFRINCSRKFFVFFRKRFGTSLALV